jgi:hypothetical protein
MEKLSIREEYGRLLNGKHIKDDIDSYKCILDTGSKLFYDRLSIGTRIGVEYDCYMLLQMMVSKGFSLIHLINGLNHQNGIEARMKLSNFIDPFSIAVLVRSQYESYCIYYNLLFTHTDSNQRTFLYDLWVLAGLNERQRIGKNIQSDDGRITMEREKKEIQELRNKISNNPCYKNFDDKETKLIETGIRDRNFQFSFVGNKIQKCAWHELFSKTGVRQDMLDDIYRWLSLYTHPSNVSVSNFSVIFKKTDNVATALYLLQISKIILAFAIRDYCTFYPEMKIVFNGYPEINQLLVNGYNRSFKDESFVVNDIERYV